MIYKRESAAAIFSQGTLFTAISALFFQGFEDYSCFQKPTLLLVGKERSYCVVLKKVLSLNTFLWGCSSSIVVASCAAEQLQSSQGMHFFSRLLI